MYYTAMMYKKMAVVSTNQFRQFGGAILPEAEPSMFSHNAVAGPPFTLYDKFTSIN